MSENTENGFVKVQEENNYSIDRSLELEVSYAPLVDIYETDNEFVLIANMPGVPKENIQLKFEDGTLSIFGRINYNEAVNRKYILNENEIGNYFRKFRVSSGIDETKIEAEYTNGQLYVTLPKH